MNWKHHFVPNLILPNRGRALIYHPEIRRKTYQTIANKKDSLQMRPVVGWVDPPKAEKPNMKVAFVWVIGAKTYN